MKIINVCPESFGANCFLLISEGKALVVDPAPSASAIQNAALKEGAKIEGIILTHGHFDHIVSIDTLRRALSIPVSIHEGDAEMLTDGRKNAFYDFYGIERTYSPADNLLRDKDVIRLGSEEIRVIHTPGHTKGSVCYLCGDFMLTGDTLFADSIGRCDLWGGNDIQIKESLHMLRSYPQNLKIYAGHGPSSVLGAALDNAAYFI